MRQRCDEEVRERERKWHSKTNKNRQKYQRQQFIKLPYDDGSVSHVPTMDAASTPHLDCSTLDEVIFFLF